jgi:hypothetical protein
MSFRTIAAGAGMFAALTFAATSTAPAQAAGTKPSAATQTRAGKAAHRVTKPQREANTRRVKRTRLARHRHRQPVDRLAQTVHRPAASPHAEVAIGVRQQTSAERRFREFLTPQSFDGVANEPLRNPRLLTANFSGEIADPELGLANASTPVESDPRAEAPPIVAGDQTTGDDNQGNAAPVAQTHPAAIARAKQTDKDPEGMSFLRWFFIAWGGVLTLASAVRMAVG